MDHALPEVVSRRLSPLERFGARATLFGIALALTGIPFGLLLHQVTTDGPMTELDESAAQWLHTRLVGNAAAEAVLQIVSFTGKPIFLSLVIGAPALWLWRKGARKLVTFLLVVSLGGGLIDTVIKIAVGRPRPRFDEPIATAFGNSFPSGHSMSAVFCYGAVLLVFLPVIPTRFRRPTVALTTLWILAIGLSRLALGVHFISDVLGGFVLGAAWLSGCVAVFEVWRQERGRRSTDPLSEGVEPEEAKAAAS